VGLVWLAGVPRAQPEQAATGRYHESIAGTLVTFEMIRVPAGPNVAEFFIGRTEVTWDMFDIFMLRLDAPKTDGAADAIARPSEPYGAPDRGWGHAGFPAMSVTRAAAEAFCQWLSAKTGRPYRLPTDAEWSHAATLAAARTGALDAIAWHRTNADGQTHPVGRRAEDALGLVDLFGNVAEWVMTGAGTFVTRGGSYRDPASAIGPDARAAQDPTWNQTDPQLPKSRWWLSDGPFVGFRLVSQPRGGPS
jgi:formylglycine-generating enzyme required for sulfatase activity